MKKGMKLSPNIALLSTAGTVGASTLILPTVCGYGTTLFQIVVLGAWSIVASLTSGAYADLHKGPVWVVSFVLNILLFLVPALMVWVVSRKRWPMICTWFLITWCLFYLSSLFFLFPATDGP